MRSIESMMAEGHVQADLQRLAQLATQKGRALPEQLYVHFKGGLYVLMTLVDYHDHKYDAAMAVYISLKTGHKSARFLRREGESSWQDKVEWPDGQLRQRFMAADNFVEYYQLLHAARVTKDPLE